MNRERGSGLFRVVVVAMLAVIAAELAWVAWKIGRIERWEVGADAGGADEPPSARA